MQASCFHSAKQNANQSIRGSKSDSSNLYQFSGRYTQSFIDDPECISLREKLLNGDISCIQIQRIDPLNSAQNDNSSIDYNQLENANQNTKGVTVDLLHKLIVHLREYEERCAASALYNEAKKVRSIQQIVKNEITKRNQISRNKSLATHSEIQFPSNPLDILKAQQEEQIKEFDKETQEKLNNANKLHQQSLDRFNNVWTTSMPRQYCKPSQRLLNLKHKEKALALTGDYDSATEVNLEAIQFANEESRQNQQKLVFDYRKAKTKLLNKQKTEINALIQYRNEQKNLILTKQENDLKIAINRTNLQQKKTLNRTRLLTSKPTTMKLSEIGQDKSLNNRNVYALPVSVKTKIWCQTPKFNGNDNEDLSDSSLLPPLIPPTDPSIHEKELQSKRDKIKTYQAVLARREEERKHRLEMVQKAVEEERKAQQQQQQMNKSNNFNKTDFEPTSSQEHNIEMIVDDINQPETQLSDDHSETDQNINSENELIQSENDQMKNSTEDSSNYLDRILSDGAGSLLNDNKDDLSNDNGKQQPISDDEYEYYEEEIIEDCENVVSDQKAIEMDSRPIHQIRASKSQNSTSKLSVGGSSSYKCISYSYSISSMSSEDDIECDSDFKKPSILILPSHSSPNLKDPNKVLIQAKNLSFSIVKSVNNLLQFNPSSLQANQLLLTLKSSASSASLGLSEVELDMQPLDVDDCDDNCPRVTINYSLHIPLDLRYIEGKKHTFMSSNSSSVEDLSMMAK